MKKAFYFILSFLVLLLITASILFVFGQKSLLNFLSYKPENKISVQKYDFRSPENIKVDNNIAKNKIAKNKKNQLYQPPKIIKGIYLTSWSAGKKEMIDYLIKIAEETEINAAIIDIKDFSGYVVYDTNIRQVEEYGAEQIRIADINFLIEKLHEEGIYLIARITVFQDPVLAAVRSDLAIHSKRKLQRKLAKLATEDSSFLLASTLWFDKSGLAWIDPAAQESWDYNIAIAKEAISYGFDEVNFDYVRFPSDGDLKDMVFPFFNTSSRMYSKHEVIRNFFEYIRQEMPEAKISIDLFGLSTISYNDLGVGQIIEDAFEYFDYVCPMIYPSHYSPGFKEFSNPAEHPYDVVEYSMKTALERLENFKKLHQTNIQIRPWLQDFDLKANYDEKMVKAEIKAVIDSAGENFIGFMLWNSRNFYTKEALKSE